MAGQGKGVLRIAIEDFFTTTKIGKWIAQWFIDFGEAQEQAIYNSYADLISKLDVWKDDPTQVIPHPQNPGEPGKQGEILTAGAFAANIGGAAASAFMAPLMRLINYKIDKAWRTNRLSPEILIPLTLRFPSIGNKLLDDIKELGWSDERIDAYFKLAQQLLNPAELIQLYHRSILTHDQVQTIMLQQGYNADQVNQLIEIEKQIPGISDLVNMADKWAWDDGIANRFQFDTEYPEIVQEWVEKLGFDKDWFTRYWRAHWQQPDIGTIFDFLHRLRPGRTGVTFTEADLQDYLKATPYSPYFHQRLTEISYHPFSRIDARRLYKAGVISEDEVYQTYLDLGYDSTHARKLADFAVLWATGEDSALTDNQTKLTESLLTDMYIKDVIDERTLRSELAKLKYPQQYIDWLVKYTQSRRKTDNTPDEHNTYQSKMKTNVLAAYTARQISAAEATQALTTAGYTSQAVNWLLLAADYDYQQGERNGILSLIKDSYITKVMDRSAAINALGKINVSGNEQNQLLGEWDTDIQYRTKRLSESDYTEALKLGIISQDKYVEDLQGLGLSDDDITVKLALFQAAQTAAQAAQQAQQQKLLETAAKKLSVTDLLDGYAKGTITEEQLYARLKTAGFTVDDVSMLISTRYNAPKPIQSRLTVAQIMTALKRGALTTEQVRTMLTARGYTPEDIDLLLASQATGTTP